MSKPRVLFVCTYYGARSQIAEAFTNQLAADTITAFSASFEAGKIGPLPMKVMKEVGIDLPAASPKSVYKRYKDKEVFDYVVTLCHETAAEQCPIFKTNVDALYAREAERVSWSIPDFKSLTGSDEARTAAARKIRDLIKTEAIKFLSQLGIAMDTT